MKSEIELIECSMHLYKIPAEAAANSKSSQALRLTSTKQEAGK